jgi:hypothetical protein
MRVNQNAHAALLPRHKFFGRQRLKKSGSKLKFVFEHPGMRFFRVFLTGTSFTTGCFPRAITISSPRSALSIKVERLVFAR